MSRLLGFLFLLAGLVMAGTVFAHEMKSDTMRGSDLGSGSQIKAAVVSKSGDTVRVFVPEGNDVLCKNDHIPIFRSTEKMESGPSGDFRWESVQSEELYKGEAPSGDISSMIEKTDLASAQLVGEVVIDNLVGDNYAEGRLLVGDASHGDIVSKPGAQCLMEPGTQIVPES